MHGLDGGVVIRDAGVWVNGMDFIHPHPLLVDWLKDTPLAQAVAHAQVGSRVGATADFRDGHGKPIDVGSPPLYTNLPWVFPIAHMFGKHVYMHAAPAEPRFEPIVSLKSTQHLLDPPRRRLTLQLDGADHMLVLFDTGTMILRPSGMCVQSSGVMREVKEVHTAVYRQLPSVCVCGTKGGLDVRERSEFPQY